LPAIGRRVCDLVAEGWSLADIARELQVPHELIKSRWRRLIPRLRTWFATYSERRLG
jgi:hypothetical protein